MGVGVGINRSSDQYDNRREDDFIGETLEVRDGHLYYFRGHSLHPVRVMATTRTIRVGCVSLTREAWELLKRKVDGVPA